MTPFYSKFLLYVRRFLLPAAAVSAAFDLSRSADVLTTQTKTQIAQGL